jgi:hypothetical protein
MKYIKKFQSKSDLYNIYGTDEYANPNVYMNISDNKIYYDKGDYLICVINTNGDNNDNTLWTTYNSVDIIDKVLFDDVEQDYSSPLKAKDINDNNDHILKIKFNNDTLGGTAPLIMNAYIKSASIPNIYKTLGMNVFNGCSGLISISIPDSVTSIDGWAFSGCSGLISIVIPDSVTSIGTDAFFGCTGLTSIAIPDSVTSIGDMAFSNCSGLTNVIISDSVTSIADNTFGGCRSLNEETKAKILAINPNCTF